MWGEENLPFRAGAAVQTIEVRNEEKKEKWKENGVERSKEEKQIVACYKPKKINKFISKLFFQKKKTKII